MICEHVAGDRRGEQQPAGGQEASRRVRRVATIHDEAQRLSRLVEHPAATTCWSEGAGAQGVASVEDAVGLALGRPGQAGRSTEVLLARSHAGADRRGAGRAGVRQPAGMRQEASPARQSWDHARAELAVVVEVADRGRG